MWKEGPTLSCAKIYLPGFHDGRITVGGRGKNRRRVPRCSPQEQTVSSGAKARFFFAANVGAEGPTPEAHGDAGGTSSAFGMALLASRVRATQVLTTRWEAGLLAQRCDSFAPPMPEPTLRSLKSTYEMGSWLPVARVEWLRLRVTPSRPDVLTTRSGAGPLVQRHDSLSPRGECFERRRRSRERAATHPRCRKGAA